MYDFLQNFHSGWAYMVVVFAIVLLGASIYFLATKKELTKTFKKISFYTTMAFHIQFVAGIILFFFSSPLGIKLMENQEMSNIMKDELARFYVIEHPLMMFASVLFLTIANAKIKRTDRMRIPFVLLILVAVLLIFMMIPSNHTFGFLQGMIRG